MYFSYVDVCAILSDDRINNRAIVASNAETEITTSYGKFTVAGSISLRSRLRGLGTYDGEADFEGILKSKMQDEYEIEFLL